jgi:hypothetical protein
LQADEIIHILQILTITHHLAIINLGEIWIHAGRILTTGSRKKEVVDEKELF